MKSRFGVMFVVAALLATAAPSARAQSTASAPAKSAAASPAGTSAAKATSAAPSKPYKVVEVIPMTCAQAWAASGKDYAQMYRMLAALATVSLTNRELTFPDTKEAGVDAGTAIAKDCEADPHGLLYAMVDKHVRRVAEGSGR